jgi:hypothetical protein
MPPRKYSRHTYTLGVTDEQGRLSLTERVPFRFRVLSDTRQHVVSDGETLWGLAARLYAGLPRPAGLWWVIADFQPEPIVDPTIALSAGQILHLPSLRVVQEQVFSEKRRQENDA